MHTQSNDATHNLLKGIYRNSTMGSESTRVLLSKAEDGRLREALQNQMTRYNEIADEAKAQMKEIGEQAQQTSAANKAQVWASIQMMTMGNRQTSHLAEMMMEGNNMGVIETTKLMNEFTEADQNARNLGTKLIDLESKSVEVYKPYL